MFLSQTKLTVFKNPIFKNNIDPQIEEPNDCRYHKLSVTSNGSRLCSESKNVFKKKFHCF